MVRMFRWNEYDVYRFFNIDHPDYPDLPPPPNPKGLQAFMIACVDVTIEQKNAESDPDAGKKGGAGRGGDRSHMPRRQV